MTTEPTKPAAKDGQEIDLETLDQASGGQAFGGQPQTVIIEDGGRHHHHHHHHDLGQTLGEVAAVLGVVAGTAAVVNNLTTPPQPAYQPQPQPDPNQQPAQPDNFEGN